MLFWLKIRYVFGFLLHLNVFVILVVRLGGRKLVAFDMDIWSLCVSEISFLFGVCDASLVILSILDGVNFVEHVCFWCDCIVN